MQSTRIMAPNNTSIPLPKDIAISVFENVKDQRAGDTTLQRFINEIQSVTRYTPAIEAMRRMDKADPAYKDIKRYLRVYTISCRIPQGQGRTASPSSNNGAICIDVDAADNPQFKDWGQVRKAIGLLPYTYIAALSAGGRGVFAVLAVDPAVDHKTTFEALALYFAKMGIAIDKACKDIARLRAISYDPNAIVRQPTRVFKAIAAAKPIERPKPRRKQLRYGADDGAERIIAAANIWVRKGIALDDYDDWTRAAASLKDIPQGVEILDAVSQFSKSYKGTADIVTKARQVQSLKRIGPATFIYLCNKYGITNEEITAERNRARAAGAQTSSPPQAPTTAAIAEAAADIIAEMGIKPPTLADIGVLDPSAEPQEPPPF